MKRKQRYSGMTLHGRSVYDQAILSLTDTDSIDSKFDTDPYATVGDQRGPNSRFERARKISEEVNADDQYPNTRWDNNDPAHGPIDFSVKDDIDALKVMVEDGTVVDNIEDPCNLEELAYHLCYNKTKSGDHDYESYAREQAEGQQQSKIDARNREEARTYYKGGFF